MIKKQDGGIYRLNGPNPLMKGQEQPDTMFVHNWDAAEVTLPYTGRIQYPNRSSHVEIHQETAEEMAGPQIDPAHLVLGVLPAKVNTRTNNLYNEHKRWISYEKPRKIPGKLINREAVRCTLVVDEELEEHSIIFAYELKEWWKVETCTKMDSKFHLLCHVSDITPSFPA